MRIHGLKKAAVVAIAALVTLGAFSAAYAIQNGQPDGNAHPYVGIIAFYDDAGNLTGWASGELLSSTVFLTAGHVTFNVTSGATKIENVRVFFDEVPSLVQSDGIEANAVYTHPGFLTLWGAGGAHGVPDYDQDDVGVVILKTEVTLARYAELPALGLVDTLKGKTPLDLVGYGVQYRVTSGRAATWGGGETRYYARSQMVPGNFLWHDQFIRLTENPGQGKGGISFGDSGGPALLAGTDILVAVTSYVMNNNAVGISYSCRVDTEDVQAWLDLFLNPYPV